MKRRSRFRYPLFAVLAFFAVSGGASVVSAQGNDLQPLLDRMDRIERDIRTLNRQFARGGTVSGDVAGGKKYTGSDFGRVFADFEVRLGAIESELRTSTGRSEELGHQIDQINQRLEKLIGDVDYRLSVLENAGRAASGGTAETPDINAAPSPPGVQSVRPGEGTGKPGVLGTIAESDIKGAKPAATSSGDAAQAKVASAASGILPQGSSKEQYTYARKLLLSQKFDQAETVFREFIKVHPDDPLLSNARYWLGETYYVRGDFRSAAKVFMQGYKTAPNGSKAPDTLLKLGMSLSRLDKKQDACTAFRKLTDDFPKLSASISKVVSRERESNNCN